MTTKLKKQMKKWIEKHYGVRCKSYTVGCPNCQAWSSYDFLFCTLTESEWTAHRKGLR